MSYGMYKPIWAKLKKDKVAVILVPAVLVARVKKAVIKEKDKDKGFKFVNVYDKVFLAVEVEDSSDSPECKKITFRLKQRYNIVNMEKT